MAFQFTCPQGHLLEADPSFAGQQCTCPHCGMLFIIPPPPAQTAPLAPMMQPGPMAPLGPMVPPGPMPQPGPMAYAPPMPQPGPMLHAPPMPQPGTMLAAPMAQAPPMMPAGPMPGPAPIGPAPSALPQVGPNFPTQPIEAVPAATKPAEPELLHIPCPNGHELDTPREMLNQEVLCPHCGEQFLLREKDSVEYKLKKQKDLEAKELRRGKLWLNWAIAIAVLVLVGLVALILATSGS